MNIEICLDGEIDIQIKPMHLRANPPIWQTDSQTALEKGCGEGTGYKEFDSNVSMMICA